MNPLNPNYTKLVGTFTNKRRDKTPTKSPIKTKTAKKSHHQSQITDYPQPQKQQSKRQLHAKFPMQDPQVYSNLTLVSQGYLYAYVTKFGIISGRSIIIFPEGIIANCYVQEQQLHGWAVIFQKDIYCNVCYFKKSKFQGKQYSYDMEKGVMAESLYKNGKLHSVIRYAYAKIITFDQFLNDKKLSELLRQTCEGVYLKHYFPTVKSKIGNYYGEVYNGIPEGLGVVMTDNELFYGQFQYGLLSGRGAIVFQSGNYYFGEFQQGNMKGLGLYYTSSGTSKYRFQTHQISQQDFINNFNLNSVKSYQALNRIFTPIIDFYHKLKIIYQKTLEQPQQQLQVSLVDINTGRSNIQSGGSAPTDRRDEAPITPITRLATEPQGNQGNEFKRTLMKLEESQREQQRIRQTKKQLELQLQRLSSTQRSPYEEVNYQQLRKVKQKEDKDNNDSNKRSGRLTKGKNKKKLIEPQPMDKNFLMSHKEWQEVIQQLTQQSVARQDSFLKVSSNLKSEENITSEGEPKYNELNARIINQKLVKICPEDDDLPGQQQKYVKKIMSKYNQ